MIRLNLFATPQWLDLAPGLRLLVGPLTTALMVSARADAAIEVMSDTATTEELALAMAKAVARRAVLDWEPICCAVSLELRTRSPTPPRPGRGLSC